MNEANEAKSSAEAAATWWAETVAGRPIHDNGDRSETGFLGMALASLAAEKHQFTDEQIDTFRSKLVEVVNKQLANLYREDGAVCLGTDYGPDHLLGAAADAARLHPTNFPWKTNTWVYRDHFVVAAGYRASSVLKWADPSWVRPPCHQQAWEVADDEFKHLPRKCGLLQYHDGDHGEWLPSPLCAVCGEPDCWFTHKDDGYSDHHEYLPAAIVSEEARNRIKERK